MVKRFRTMWDWHINFTCSLEKNLWFCLEIHFWCLLLSNDFTSTFDVYYVKILKVVPNFLSYSRNQLKIVRHENICTLTMILYIFCFLSFWYMYVVLGILFDRNHILIVSSGKLPVLYCICIHCAYKIYPLYSLCPWNTANNQTWISIKLKIKCWFFKACIIWFSK